MSPCVHSRSPEKNLSDRRGMPVSVLTAAVGVKNVRGVFARITKKAGDTGLRPTLSEVRSQVDVQGSPARVADGSCSDPVFRPGRLPHFFSSQATCQIERNNLIQNIEIYVFRKCWFVSL